MSDHHQHEIESVAGLQILRMPAVIRFSGHKRSQLWAHVRDGTFPKPVKLSENGRAVGWLVEELLEWRRQRITVRDQGRQQHDDEAA